jgi:hypothetical protein
MTDYTVKYEKEVQLPQLDKLPIVDQEPVEAFVYGSPPSTFCKLLP